MLCYCSISYDPLFVCLANSICLSKVGRSIKAAKPMIKQTTVHNSPQIPVFLCKDHGEIPLGPPPTQAPNASGVQKTCNFRQISRHIRKWYKQGAQFVWKVTSKSCEPDQMVTLPMNLWKGCKSFSYQLMFDPLNQLSIIKHCNQ